MKPKFENNPAGIGTLIIAVLLFSCINVSAQVKPAKDLKNTDMTQYVFADSAGHEVSIKDLKGKYVLLDIWASWCRPCISRFPEFDSLETTYKDRNIAFIQLSCDAQERRWKNEMGFTGRRGKGQWFINGNDKFMTDLEVATIPRYLLIDRDGKLIDPRMEWKNNDQVSTLLKKLKGI